MTIDVDRLKEHLPGLLGRLNGEELLVTRDGTAVARLVPISPTEPSATSDRPPPGAGKGTFQVIGDIDEPLPDDLLEEFYNDTLDL